MFYLMHKFARLNLLTIVSRVQQEVEYRARSPTYLDQTLELLDGHLLKLVLTVDTYLLANQQYGEQADARPNFLHDMFALIALQSTGRQRLAVLLYMF